MTSNNGSAKILDMEDARVRRQASVMPGADFPHAGAHLHAVRNASGLTLLEAASRTHIKIAHLEAIEEMSISDLPPRPYAIGFVKTYAEFLDLDAAILVSRFKEEADFSAPQVVSVEKFEAAEAAADNEHRDMSLKAVVAIMVFIVWCAWQITRPHEVKTLGAAPVVTHSDNAASTLGFSVTDTTAQSEFATIIEARLMEQVDPVYPLRCASSAQAIETIVLSFNITAEGRVTGERVASSSNGCLDQAALNAVRRWRFEPRIVDSAPRPTYNQKYSFSFQRPR
ncbi:MAG: TonB family protein [Alphaproteobacteria bacterium]|nr:TonB family protein [Alphaproteobacteria bacterium]